MQNSWLLFASGVVAWLNRNTVRTLTSGLNPVALGQMDTVTHTDAGWTVGGGIEYGFAPNWSVDVEYRYLQIDTGGEFVYSVPAADVHTNSTLSTVRIGINYHFN